MPAFRSSTRRRVRTSLRSGNGYTASGASTRRRCVPLSAMRRPIACSQKHVSLVPRSQLDASWCSRCVNLRAEDGRVRG